MGFCGNCGNEVPEGMNFCPNCGTAMVKTGNTEVQNTAAGFENDQPYRMIEHVQPEPAVDKALPEGDKVSGIDRLGKFYGILLMIISIMDLITDPALVTILLSVFILIACIFCFYRKYKLKGFTIIAFIVAALCLLMGVFQAKKIGLLAMPDKNNTQETSEDTDSGTETDQTASKENDTASEQAEEKYTDVTYGSITFAVPEKYFVDVEHSGTEDTYCAKNNEATFNILETGSSYSDSQFHSLEARTMLTDHFLEWVDKLYDDPKVVSSEYEEVAGQDSIVVQYSCRTEGYDAICNIAIINDQLGDKTVAACQRYYISMEDEYGDDFWRLIETAGNGKSKPASSYSGSRNKEQVVPENKESDNASAAGGVDPELKAALDEYEAFMNEYVDFMKKYKEDPGNAISMLADYTSMMAKYAEFVSKIDGMKTDDMSKEDLAYYLDVINRVEKKMLDVAY